MISHGFRMVSQGLSCESCDLGYTRSIITSNSTSGAGGGGTSNTTTTTTTTRTISPQHPCTPCQCNLHALTCDALTGACHCLHNTDGHFCQLCSKGYYGLATNGFHGQYFLTLLFDIALHPLLRTTLFTPTLPRHPQPYRRLPSLFMSRQSRYH